MADGRRRATGIVGALLVAAGAALLLFVAAMQAYSAYSIARYPQAPAAPSAGDLWRPPPRASADPAIPVRRAAHGGESIDGQPGRSPARPIGGLAAGTDAWADGDTSPLEVGSPAIRIVIPWIGVDAEIIEIGARLVGDHRVWDPPSHVAGHYAETANPGEIGNIAITGHISSPISSQGSVFRRLPELRLGDVVLLIAEDGGQFLYSVVETRIVSPSEVSVLDPTGDQTLTLITCFPDWVYSHRLVIRATRVPLIPADAF